MKKLITFALSLLISLSVLNNQTLACTTFCLKNKGEVLFGKNYDWMIGDGLIFVNKRGVSKTATSEAAPNPAKWVSKYGSVTFNQYGRENPSGGMNEAGLVIELMWLDETVYPKEDSRPALGTLEWIQYQLDSSATVEEVIKNAENVRIASEVKLHYLVNDANGNSATVEFLNGNLVARAGEKLAFSALANDTYEKSLNYAKTNAIEKAKSQSSFDRFTRASQKSAEFGKQSKTEKEAVGYAFDVLADVAQTGYTQWSIVYDQKRGKIYFRSQQSPAIKSIDAKSFDYACGGVVKIFDLNSKESGDVSAKFANYTREANRNLIERSFNGTPFLKGIPAFFKDFAASYPENFICEAKGQKAETQEMKEETDKTSFSYAYLAFPLYYFIKQIVS
ncbi:MAG TPA: linear amide C-N hydrolase [Pyrinomonadaceae bacterium]